MKRFKLSQRMPEDDSADEEEDAPDPEHPLGGGD
jgi:hypothetical protein